MINLFDLPRSETEKHHVFFDNVTGCATIVTIMTKDNSPVAEGSLRTCMVAFIDRPLGESRFAWHEDVNTLPERPFTEEWVLSEYERHRKAEFDKVE